MERELALARQENFRTAIEHQATYAVLSKRDSEHAKQITRLTQLHKRDQARIKAFMEKRTPVQKSLAKMAQDLGTSFSAAKILYDAGWADGAESVYESTARKLYYQRLRNDKERVS
jgi:hypothetical protein